MCLVLIRTQDLFQSLRGPFIHFDAAPTDSKLC